MHSVSQLRRRARRQGLRLVKYRESSRWYARYGPLALVDEQNYLVAWGMSPEAVVTALDRNQTLV
jgi:hypothetical protein